MGLPAQMPDKAVQKAARAASDVISSQGPMQAFEGAIVKEALAAGRAEVAAARLTTGFESLEDGIAEAFAEFAKKEGLSFFR